MENIGRTLSILKGAHYLQATIETSNLCNLELLSLGKRLRAQIERHWQLTQTSEPQLKEIHEDGAYIKEVDPRLQFIYTKTFRENFKLLKVSNNDFTNVQPIKIKLVEKSDENKATTQLVTDHFFHESCALAKLYKIQRERKIWWMLFSSDPSRYYLEPYKLSHNSAMPNAQSITIKSRLCLGDLSVEHITLVPLTDVELEYKKYFEIYNGRINKTQLPVVIRSVIDLDLATCALIFDGAANKKRDETLFLNRKLAPYQCQILIESKDSCLSELKALSTHLSNVMSRSGLRIFKNDVGIEHELDLETQYADHLGIPFLILVNSDSLKTGLLKLRNRDTTLKETIHISDIPRYLLSIFCAS